jgi:hypothetical protein
LCTILINEYENYNFLDHFDDPDFHPHQNKEISENLAIPPEFSQMGCLDHKENTDNTKLPNKTPAEENSNVEGS